MEIRKVYMQHNSLVVNVPKEVGAALKLKRGSYVSFSICEGGKYACVEKIESISGGNHADKEHQNEQDKSGAARTAVPVRRRKDAGSGRVDFKTRALASIIREG
ncbi:hypothetical protein LCGC14_2835250 [marine sediment metagenome]|uniref:Uncharacterized protein n=1 Tax=marine sediment metagenome TaxID=412755 RepID=A0A0F8YD00_9ZZZZ